MPRHRPALRAALATLRKLQGAGAVPLEHRVVELVSGVYDLRMFGFPLPIDAVQMRAAERMPHVINVEFDPSLSGISPNVVGALCVRVDLTSLGVDKRAAAAIVDEDDDDIESFDEKRRRGPSKATDAESEGALGWIGRLFFRN